LLEVCRTTLPELRQKLTLGYDNGFAFFSIAAPFPVPAGAHPQYVASPFSPRAARLLDRLDQFECGWCRAR
jgi:hypothetical protein